MALGAKIAEHRHICYQVYYIIQGHPVFVIDGTKFHLQPGSFFYIPPQTPHKMLMLNEPLDSFDFKIQIHDSFLLSHLHKTSEPFQDSGYIKSILEYIQANWGCKDTQNIENIDTLMTSLLMNFFLNKLQYDTLESCRIITQNYTALSKSIITYIDKNYEKKFSLQELAEKLGHNQNYMSAAFSKNTGVTIIEYLNLIRIRHAMILITFFLQDIFTAYQSSGFSNASHFSRTFKALVGTSPRNVRYVFSQKNRNELSALFETEPILNFQVYTLEETFASLKSIGTYVNQVLQKSSVKC